MRLLSHSCFQWLKNKPCCFSCHNLIASHFVLWLFLVTDLNWNMKVCLWTKALCHTSFSIKIIYQVLNHHLDLPANIITKTQGLVDSLGGELDAQVVSLCHCSLLASQGDEPPLHGQKPIKSYSRCNISEHAYRLCALMRFWFNASIA